MTPPKERRLSFIYSACYQTARAFYPPSHPEGTRTDSPPSMVYANLQPPEGTAWRSPVSWWSLTPPSHPYFSHHINGSHPYNFLWPRSKWEAVILFSLHLLSLTAGIFTSGASYAARTFLSCTRHQRQTAALLSNCKGTKKSEKWKVKSEKFAAAKKNSYLWTTFECTSVRENSNKVWFSPHLFVPLSPFYN